MESTKKCRTPSQCREWERRRRNKFNAAIAELGKLVEEINKANDSAEKDADTAQYPKIEIVQKAIICLNNCAQEKTQLKAEILALQIEIEAGKNKKSSKKDVSTQVYIINKKSRNDKYIKLLMLKKSKRNALKEKPVLTTNATVKPKEENKKLAPRNIKQNLCLQNLPQLLPKPNCSNRKGSENTIVVLPATPYIFPQRPLLLPTVPPAIVLVDHNMQTLSKSSIPLMNRGNNDITKTTMVNILPISAYSRPLSATKIKKNNVKTRSDATKKTKTPKSVGKIIKESVVNNKPSGEKSESSIQNNVKLNEHKHKNNEKDSQPLKISESVKQSLNTAILSKDNDNLLVEHNNKNDTNIEKNSTTELAKIINTSKNEEISTNNEVEKVKTTSTADKIVNNNENRSSRNSRISPEKDSIAEDKNKENKLPSILDNTLCENVVDGGNARLELAEEFLAASPTAAFLMSFPLVSGNRADSPAEDPSHTILATSKDNNQRRMENVPQSNPYFEKTSNDVKTKSVNKTQVPSIIFSKPNDEQKYVNNNIASKQIETKNTITISNVSTENPFLNLPMTSLISTNCTLSDSTYGLDFECNISKSMQTQSSTYVNNNNFFYKTDPFSSVKNTIYSTSSISSGHEFNSLGLYPCAMEKYSSKNKSDFANVEDNLMKIGSSRLTYDIDLGWSHKSFDFVTCTTTSNSFNKDMLTTTSTTYSTSYNPFNPEFHVPLVSNSNKKDISNKPNSSFADTITSFYSQSTNLWPADHTDMPFYTNSGVSKSMTTKYQNYLSLDHIQPNAKQNNPKHYEPKQLIEPDISTAIKSTNANEEEQISNKYTKKSPSKMHINWMTSEIRPMQSNCNPLHIDIKEPSKPPYPQLDHVSNKKHDNNETNYFPISIHNFTSQTAQEEFQVWPSTRPLGTTEISIEPPPINLPTLVGDLALGPHDKKKNADVTNRVAPHIEVPNCSNFLSVTQLMNRSTDMSSRYQGTNIGAPKSITTKQNTAHFSTNDLNRKSMNMRVESGATQSFYGFNDTKSINSYENVNQFAQNKPKPNKSEKNTKAQKNSYSAEALIRGGPCTQKIPDNNSSKFMMASQKYNDFHSVQDSSIAQVSHFPAILDYSDSNYTGQQFSGANLYNSTTNTISNSFYSNFMPGSANLMSSNYTSGPFTSEFIDYSQTADCNYSNHKYEELKIRNNPSVFHQDKVPSNYKSSRRESTAKHKLECSKKDSSKKYQSKRPKLNSEAEEWNDSSHLLWQNKTSIKRNPNLVTEELSFTNYVGNQMSSQYQPDFFNSHLMPSNTPSVGHNVDRCITSFPATSRANFNLSTIFPEITMKVQ